MKKSLVQNSRWYLATTLRERIDLIKAAGPAPLASKTELSERRFQQWRAQGPFTNEAVFAQRIASEVISEGGFRQGVGESGATIRESSPTPPSWLTDLDSSFSTSLSSSQCQFRAIPEAVRQANYPPMLAMVAPLISFGRACLREKIQVLIRSRSDLPWQAGAIEPVLYANLPERLLWILGRSAVLELNVLRLRGVLQGDSSEQRFQSFVKRMSTRGEAHRFLRDYPVLARLLTECVRHWADASLEFLQHLCEDWQLILSIFCKGNDPGSLIRVDAGAGDSHNRGRSVIIATFSSGFRLVYKPRSLSVDVHFQDLLVWLNQRGVRPEFRALTILDRANHGWVEFVSPQGCGSTEELSRFYRRQGGYLALLYALEAVDFHYENLIAAGEHPVLLDIEALFHPRVQGFDPRRAEEVAYGAIFYSVLGVGLLPHRIRATPESAGVDLSGMGMQSGQVTPYPVPQWEAEATDEMRLIRKPVVLPGAQNRPSINGADGDPGAFSGEIVSGFEAVYKLLLKHRTELLSDNGPIARFAEDEIRVIFRATRTYATLLHESYHPDVLHDAIDRDWLFDRLWGRVEGMPYMARVIPFERQDLWNGDIPRFTTRPGARHVWSASGEQIPDLLDEPSINLARRRLDQLNTHDLGRQVWVIRASLATASTTPDLSKSRKPARHPAPEHYAPADRALLLDAALAIGEQLETLALRGDDDVCWIGLATEPSDQHSYSFLIPLGLDLYDGVPGVMLFLAFLGAITGEERYTLLAEAALRTVRRQIEGSRSFFRSIGGFGGWAGVIYTLGQLATLWNQPALLTEAGTLVEHLPNLIDENEHFDIVHGDAGCIAGLLSFYDCASSARAVAAATLCGKRLVARAERCKQGIGWRKQESGKPLTGFSHGAAGVAWALLKLSDVTGNSEFRGAATDAIRYERSLFSEEFQNWPDLRSLPSSVLPENDQRNYAVAWCNGAAGIGLARFASLPYLDDLAMRADINAALRTTLSKGFGFNHSLCHGDLGNVELLLQASQKLSDPQWGQHLSGRTAMILDSIGRNGSICGAPSTVESPGLMTGLAGIGYELLRLAEPRRVPCVLLLEPLNHASARQAAA
jgi:type 2 lantibiotic biosynthesis protein LanM